MESVREFKITLYIDTNKRTIEKTFDDIEELIVYLDTLGEAFEHFQYHLDE